jgi:hypothetical protein
MTTEERDLVTLGADVGGKDAYAATNEAVLALRKLLTQKCKGPYGTTVKEIALVLRIDGSIQAWGKSGPEGAAFREKSTVATVDVFITAREWQSQDAHQVRRVLAKGTADAIEALAALAERRKIDIAIDRLRADVSAATVDYLV